MKLPVVTIESSNCEEENEVDGSGERQEDQTKIPEQWGSSKRNLLLFEQKQQLIIEYRRNLEFTKDEKAILLLSKLEHMEHLGEQGIRFVDQPGDSFTTSVSWWQWNSSESKITLNLSLVLIRNENEVLILKLLLQLLLKSVLKADKSFLSKRIINSGFPRTN